VATDVLGGQVPLGFVDVPSSIANVRAGRLRALAVTTRERISAAPEIPTFAEAGVPGYEAIGWFGVVAPAATPRDIVERLNRVVVDALGVPEFRSRALAAGAEPKGSTPQEFAAFIHAEIGKWAEVIKSAKVRID
jgi:tripartite-type tricarboxylate transporter receptor subunit TctC